MTERNGPEPASDEVHLPEGGIEIHHHYEFPDTRVARVLDAVIARIGKLFSWLWLVVMIVILWSVISRYVFGQGSILLEELSWYLYALVTDDHVRVDVLHERFALRTQAWIELLGLLLLLLPFLLLGVYYGSPYFWHSFLQGETSQALNWGALAWQTEWDDRSPHQPAGQRQRALAASTPPFLSNKWSTKDEKTY